jgi:hypothetical protein
MRTPGRCQACWHSLSANLRKVPVELRFQPEAARESKDCECAALKIAVCPETHLPIIEGAIDAASKLDAACERLRLPHLQKKYLKPMRHWL